MAWMSPSLRLEWGDYFKPDPTEQKMVVDMVRVAVAGDGGALIPRRNAVQKLAQIFGIDNVDAALALIDEEAADRQAQALEIAQGEAAALHGIHGSDGGEAAPGRQSAGPATPPAARGGAPGAPAPKSKEKPKP